MNRYKLNAIMRHVREQGRLPEDRWGDAMNVDDLLVWYGLSGRLTTEEEAVVKRELVALQEAERFAEGWRMEEKNDWLHG